MTQYIDLVNEKLTEYINTIENKELQEAIRYSLLPGGKRLRPLLLLTILNDLNVDLEDGINAACAIEMIHSYSLIHDDLPAMDNDDYRRGQLTVHKKFNESLAILAADALLTDAFRYFCKGKLPNEVLVKLVVLASKNAGCNGMVEGQVLDMAKYPNGLNLEDVKKIHLHKTKDLINLSMISAGIIANLNPDEINLLDDLSYYFGLAFQIKDDIDDAKEENSDIINDKATYPKVVGLEKSKEILKEYKQKSLEIIHQLFGEKDLYQLIERIL